MNDISTWLKEDALSILFVLLPSLILLSAVLFQGLDATYVLLIYWAESAIIGIYTVLKMLTARPADPVKRVMSGFMKFFLTPFFIVHFGIFMTVHLIFIVAYMTSLLNIQFVWNTSLMIAPILCIVAMFFSHGFEFAGFLRKERDTDPSKIMFTPYPRIIIMQFIIIFGFFLLRFIGLTMVLVSGLVVIKAVVDMALAWRRRAATGS